MYKNQALIQNQNKTETKKADEEEDFYKSNKINTLMSQFNM